MLIRIKLEITSSEGTMPNLAYEKAANLADTRDGAIEILQNKLANLQRQLNNIWNQQ